jgi:sugar phosphate isomerase/epimerase
MSSSHGRPRTHFVRSLEPSGLDPRSFRVASPQEESILNGPYAPPSDARPVVSTTPVALPRTIDFGLHRLAVCEMSTRHWTFEDDVLHYRAAGIPAMAAWYHKLQDYGEDKAIDLLQEHPLAVSSLWFGGAFIDPDELRAGDPVADTIEALDVAEELRAKTVVLISGPRGSFTRNHARRLFRDALLCLGDAAALRNLSISIAPLLKQGPGHASIVTSIQSTLDLLADCNHPHIGLTLDVAAFAQETWLHTHLPDVVPLLKSVTLSSGSVRKKLRGAVTLPGEAAFPHLELVARLCEAGYTGAFDCRVLANGLDPLEYRPLLARCKAGYQQLAQSLANPSTTNPA